MSFEQEILEQKKQTYKQLFGDSGIMTRPENTVSWSVFKEDYYGNEKIAKNALNDIGEKIRELTKITKKRTLKKNSVLIMEVRKKIAEVENIVKNVIYWNKIED
jgi:hypothetical protein